MSQLGSGVANRNESNRAMLMPTNEKDTSVFYLKLQWIAAKDDAERKNLAERIRRLLTDEKKPAKKS